MSAKTKIVVLRMKELLYVGIFAVLGILIILFIVTMLLPDKEDSSETPSPSDVPLESNVPTQATPLYIPGIYTTELILGGESVDVQVIVDKSSIVSIDMVNLSEAITTMYPLLQPTFDTICDKVCETQSLDNISYTADNKYTSLVLLEAIRNSLDKASLTAVQAK